MTPTRTCATIAGGLALVVGTLAACGTPTGTTPSPRSPSAAASSPAPTTDEVWTAAMVRQASPHEDPVLCVGAILQSYPPQCAGHVRLVGWDWADLTNETVASGITWVDTTYVVGTYADATFTLTRPPSELPPPGAVVERPGRDDELSPLCDDPMRGAESSASAGVRADNRAKDALNRHLEGMDGYVASWVSDHRTFMNVVVTGDAEAARSELRRVWAGRLCVEQRDVATRADMMVALEALMAADLPNSQCLGGGPGTEGRLHVSVTLADPETVATIHRLVAEHLDPEDLVITARLRPLTS